MRARIDAQLEAGAAAGRTARESAAAREHRQPTPGSIAAAEERVDGLSAQQVEAVAQAMARARAADSAGDKDACERALVDVERALAQ